MSLNQQRLPGKEALNPVLGKAGGLEGRLVHGSSQTLSGLSVFSTISSLKCRFFLPESVIQTLWDTPGSVQRPPVLVGVQG